MRASKLMLCLSVLAAPAYAASPEPVAGSGGMVVSAQHLASEVGADVMRRGGNAVDAAVAVGYALAVVYPQAGNIGGGGFMTVHLADGRSTFFDFREKRPPRPPPPCFRTPKAMSFPACRWTAGKPAAFPAP